MDDIMEDSIIGYLKVLRFKKTPPYIIYPIVGASKVTCNFPHELRDLALEAVNHYVLVEGMFKYRHGSAYPYSVSVSHLEIYSETGTSQLSDLCGIAPNATGGLTSEDFVRQMRDSDWD